MPAAEEPSASRPARRAWGWRQFILPRSETCDPRAAGPASPGWGTGRRRLIFPAVFLIYLAQTGAGILKYSGGFASFVGFAILAAFVVCYLAAVLAGMNRTGTPRMFWQLYTALIVLIIAELPFAHQDALVMLTYVAVLTVAARFARSVPVLILFVAAAIAVPLAIPSWRSAYDPSIPLSIALVSLAMFGFFGLVRANEALAEARAEVARLAAEGERSRIARDLHDLLGHSLTSITVKAGLASRLAERDPERAAAEIREVEELSRRTLGDVRAAVSGYRDLTLANELAAAREVLRAAGIAADLPSAVDSVDQRHSDLFAWVVREGVTNVVRHSRATRCTVRITPGAIEITDDGTAGRSAGAGNGLSGLAERVAENGGRLVAGPRIGADGWRVYVETEPGDGNTGAVAGSPATAQQPAGGGTPDPAAVRA
jgi:two-component system sensor histidine kinase DesK